MVSRSSPSRSRTTAVTPSVVLGQLFELGAVEDPDARLRRGVREQQRLEVKLIDPVPPFRGRPMAIGALLAADAAGARWQLDARQLGAQRRDAAGHVVAIFRRQAGVADFCRDAEPAENLHRSRRDLVALDVGRFAGPPCLDHRHIDAARGEVHREGEPHRARPRRSARWRQMNESSADADTAARGRMQLPHCCTPLAAHARKHAWLRKLE